MEYAYMCEYVRRGRTTSHIAIDEYYAPVKHNKYNRTYMVDVPEYTEIGWLAVDTHVRLD